MRHFVGEDDGDFHKSSDNVVFMPPCCLENDFADTLSFDGIAVLASGGKQMFYYIHRSRGVAVKEVLADEVAMLGEGFQR